MADAPPSIPPGKKIVERRLPGGNREWVVRDDNSCWVATAFYMDPDHFEVVALRRFRDEKLDNPLCRPLVHLYYQIGKTEFSRWWSEPLWSNRQRTLRWLVSRTILSCARRLAG